MLEKLKLILFRAITRALRVLLPKVGKGKTKAEAKVKTASKLGEEDGNETR